MRLKKLIITHLVYNGGNDTMGLMFCVVFHLNISPASPTSKKPDRNKIAL